MSIDACAGGGGRAGQVVDRHSYTLTCIVRRPRVHVEMAVGDSIRLKPGFVGYSRMPMNHHRLNRPSNRNTSVLPTSS